MFFLFSSRRRHTRCALVTGVQTGALPISCLLCLTKPAFPAFLIPLSFRDARLGRDRRQTAEGSCASALGRIGIGLRIRSSSCTSWALRRSSLSARCSASTARFNRLALCVARAADRKSVVWGTGVLVRVDLGGCRIIKKKNTIPYNHIQQNTTTH